MNRNLHLKKNDSDKINGAEKHRFNAEYSDELEFGTKKSKKLSKRKASLRRRLFADLH